MHYSQVLACSVVALVNTFAAASEPTFRTWFEAPETVMAGETFEVSLWASFEVDGVPAAGGLETGWISEAFASIEVAGNVGSFQSISVFLGDTDNFVSVGFVDGSRLRDFFFVQWPPTFPGFWVQDFSNPLSIGTFEISTSSQLGILELNLQPSTGRDIPILGWWQVSEGGPVGTTSPGVAWLSDSAIIRVIPAPASLILLAPLAIVSTQRRRG